MVKVAGGAKRAADKRVVTAVAESDYLMEFFTRQFLIEYLVGSL